MAGPIKVSDTQAATVNATASTEAAARLSQESNQIGMTGVLGDADRIARVTGKGLEETLPGIVHAGENVIAHPLSAVETVATSAAVGVALKTLLPEAGSIGTLAGLGMGAYFIGSSLPGFIDAYGKGLDAKTWGELDQAGSKWGDTAGQLAVSSGEGYLGYRLGAGAADKVLLNEKFDGFSEAKQNFWNGATDMGKAALPDSVAGFLGVDKSISTAASLGLKPHYTFSDGTATLMDSMREKPAGTDLGPTDPEKAMNASVTLQRINSGVTKDRYIRRMSLGKAEGLTDEDDAFQKKFGASQESLDAVKKFAAKHNLKIDEADLRSGRVLLSGKTGDFQKAFQTEIRDYQGEDGKVHQGRIDALSMPSDLASHVKAVMGIDERPFASPSSKVLRQLDRSGVVGQTGATETDAATTGDAATAAAAKHFQGYLATDIAKAQNFPLKSGGAGQRGSFIALGGGVDVADNLKFYDDNGLVRPNPLGIIEVDGAKNSPGDPDGADGENSLDAIQMQSLAPKAKVDMILGPNTDQGFNDVFVRGVFQQAGEDPNSVVSSSWGANEAGQTKQAISAMSDTFKDAAIRNVQVLSASGDTGAKDGAKDNEVDYPASDPNVVGVGGLKMLLGKDGKISSAVAWNKGQDSSTGGGISKLFKLPTWQAAYNKIMNLDTGKPGRGVPDVSTVADPQTGFRIRVDGKEFVIGGTSDAAPLYGGMLLNINSDLAAAGIKPVTPLNPWMYARGNDKSIFTDVTSGGNNGYKSAKGWDPVTGLGYIDGTGMLNAMKANQTVNIGRAATHFTPRGVNMNAEQTEDQTGQ